MNIFKKKKLPLIMFNREQLNADSQDISDKLHGFRHDDCMKMMLNLIRIGRNIALLDCASSRSEEERIKDQGKLKAYDELQIFIETALNRKVLENKEGIKPITGTINAFRRASNSAQSAI